VGADEGPVVAGYLRVSSRSQTVETQRDAIQRCATARGEPVTHWFEEKRTAKALANRPALDALCDLIRRGGVRILYVYRIDRLSRSGIRDTFFLLENFRGAGVVVVTVADGFAMDGVASDIVLAVLAWAAQMERLAIGERIADAHTRIKNEGGQWGRPRRVDGATAARIREAHEEDGRSVRELAIAYGIPRSTIARCLSRKPTSPPLSPSPGKKARDPGAVQ
jgi:DNA invertase Pin-like site-specific DNA recombinase